jgi:arylsulfatase A-like enzyme
MPPHDTRNRLATLLLVAGVGSTAASVLADPLTGGSPGFGIFQWALLICGVVLTLVGARLRPTTWASLRGAVGTGPHDVMLTATQIGLLALGTASATALLEGVALVIVALTGEMLRLDAHAVWMAAVTNTIVLSLFGAALYAIGGVWPKARTALVVSFIFAGLAIEAIAQRVPAAARADEWSKLLLAAGVASVVARAVSATLRKDRTPLRRAALASAGVVALVGVATAAVAPLRERLAHRDLPPAADHPSVLLIILDTVRAASLGLYGYERPTTPQLERFARSGVVFDRAMAPSSWTLPSHASLFTGRYPNELTADWAAPLDRSHPTLAEVLSRKGYVTAGFSANGAYANANTGLERGFARFEDFPVTASEAVRTSSMLRRVAQRFGAGKVLRDGYTGRKSARDIGERFLEWQADQPRDRPFFAFLNYFDAHDPYIAARPFDTLFAPVTPFPSLDWGNPPAPELVTAWTDHYDRAIAYLDHELGALFAELERRGVLDRTIVVVTADHGEHLGEHGFMRHGTTLFVPVLHVPLIVRYPARAPGSARVEEPVTLRDLPATILDLAGIDDSPIPGHSLASAWRDAEPRVPDSPLFAEVRKGIRVPSRYPSADADLHSLFTGGLHYIRDTRGGEWLYRYEDDPAEAHDLATDADQEAELRRLRAMLDRHLGTPDVARSSPGSRD